MSLRITSEPAVEPVTTAEAKEHLRIDGDVEDDRIDRLILSARKWVESVTWRQLITATYEWKIDRLLGALYVPRPPLQSVASLAYVDAEGDAQTLDANLYTVDADSEPGRIIPAFNQSWPSTQGHMHDVTVTFDAGYGDAASDVPGPIREAILLMIGHLYDNPAGCSGPPPMAIDALLSPYRVYDTRVTRWL